MRGGWGGGQRRHKYSFSLPSPSEGKKVTQISQIPQISQLWVGQQAGRCGKRVGDLLTEVESLSGEEAGGEEEEGCHVVRGGGDTAGITPPPSALWWSGVYCRAGGAPASGWPATQLPDQVSISD